jgi:probable phosphoglycerate mutase
MTEPAPEIVLVRHGETEWSRSGRHPGRTDLPLTPVGQGQVERLTGQLHGRRFIRVLSSPLRRAFDTCRRAGLDGAAEMRDDLLEWDYGAYEGRTTAEIRVARPGWSLWADAAAGGETAADVGTRIDPLVAELRAARGDVAVFAHGHVLRVLAARWIALPPADGRRFALDTATVSVLGWERETPVIIHWNQRCGGEPPEVHLLSGSTGGTT